VSAWRGLSNRGAVRVKRRSVHNARTRTRGAARYAGECAVTAVEAERVQPIVAAALDNYREIRRGYGTKGINAPTNNTASISSAPFMRALVRHGSVSNAGRKRWSLLLFAQSGIEVSTRFHSFVQDANDLDNAGLCHPIVDGVRRLPDGATAAIPTDVLQMKAADAWKEVFPIPSHRTLWIGRNLSHAGDQELGVPPPALIAPPLGARRQDLLEVKLRRTGEAKAGHRLSGPGATASE